MTQRVQEGELQVAHTLYELVNHEIIPGTDVAPKQFWQGLERIINELGPENIALLNKRDNIQLQMDEWHKSHRGETLDVESYKAFLTDIGYLMPEGADFNITTTHVDSEIASIAGPQLVVPVNNARFALNAANARWGSLYDALYGTDVISEDNGCEKSGAYNPRRGAKVILWAAEFLDKVAPLVSGSHVDVIEYQLVAGTSSKQLNVRLTDNNITTLADTRQLAGYRDEGSTFSLLLTHNDLHVEVQVDRNHPIGKTAASGVKDVVIESAISTILDCEDSVAAVDADDKTLVYRNWLGLMKGTLEESFQKGDSRITRRLNSDRIYNAPDGSPLSLHGRSLLLVRNVGHLMTTPAILDKDGKEIPEGILDAFITSLCAIHDLKGNSTLSNSRTGSVYIVKPKMHGPEEAAFTNKLFGCVEDVLNLPRNTLKVGVMDEERRTSANLKECIRAVKERLVFINTGFLDRTGDEIHTCMEAGPVLPKDAIKTQSWILSYEDRNVDIGLKCGLQGKAQIGKGMWPKPDEMLEMMNTKTAHPLAGANCAWVPSPTAATLHATHYHEVNVKEQQKTLSHREMGSLDLLLTPPILAEYNLSPQLIQSELDNNAQGILGYVVRWVEQGIGCSKVPDINNVGLMEDRATLRISSQHLANWLHHGICTDDQVMETLKRMASVVDVQNAGDPDYRKMTPDYDASVAFQAACDLVFKGCEQSNGYTEPVLHAKRQEAKVTYS
ncbi:malate synthase G [Endozoicomonas sp. (ex Bugula neritina AB1)]|nr:malate synthase G [Endozoicomonas sp. (ex Bugula neritina AB1)]